VILAIDPGNTQSGFVLFDECAVVESGTESNAFVLARIVSAFIAYPSMDVAIEMIASYGMPVGADVFETCVWIGRFVERANSCGIHARLIYRRDVKMHLCGNARAKDGNIRQALLDLLGPQGKKKAPGPTYGVKSHAWSALAVAATALNLQPQNARREVAKAA
jgi:hypothetical protein